MPILTLKFKEMTIREYRLDKEQNLTIGRREGNDVIIENLAVSGHHAKIDSVGEGFILTDLKSKNGTFVNNEAIASHWLKAGDIVTIGKHNLVFDYAEGEDRPAEEGAMEQTMALDTDQYREMVTEVAPEVTGVPPQKESVGVLSFLSGGEGEVELSKKLTKIGKDPSCDLVVGGIMVGKTAVTVSKRPTGYYLSYVGGLAKPKVNGETIKESIRLREFDKIELGSSRMEFFYR
jgi:pSer/pThr/pTyr-binding forkhead associated (FHA) protein